MGPSDEWKVCYVLGSGHCGSTLLNLLLNGHSRVLGLSEINQLSGMYPPDGSLDNTPFSSPFWQNVIKCYEQSASGPFSSIPTAVPTWRELLNWDVESWEHFEKTHRRLFNCLHEQSSCSILVDSSKFPQRLYQLIKTMKRRLKVIHLVRDGRGVLNSYVRKYDRFRVGFRRWLSPSLLAMYLRAHLDKKQWIRVYYEDLATETVEELTRICGFLDIEYEPGMRHYQRHPYEGLGGNRMRNEQSGNAIKLDKSWKRDLKFSRRITFEILGGWLNRLYGYHLFE